MPHRQQSESRWQCERCGLWFRWGEGRGHLCAESQPGIHPGVNPPCDPSEPLTAYGLPVTVCEKAPTDGSWALLPLPADTACPWCGKPLAEHGQWQSRAATDKPRHRIQPDKTTPISYG